MSQFCDKIKKHYRMMQPKISIVIRCFNEQQHIGRLLQGITQQTLRDVEIIVVDSGSTDGTIVTARKYPVKLLSIRSEDFSFGRSLNLGCQATTAEFIVIASAHVYPIYDDWLEKMAASMSDPQIALAYGKQRGHPNTKYSEHQVFTHWFPEQPNPRQDHPFCNNANSIIRRSLWEQMPYDEELTGLEDLDWATRILAQGYRLAYVPEAEVIHVHNETWTQIRNRYRREAIAFKRIFPHEHFYFRDFIRLLTTNTISDYYYALYENVIHRHLFSIPMFRLMQFWGTYQGYRHRGPITKQLRQTFYYPRGLTRNKNQINGKTEEDRRAISYN